MSNLLPTLLTPLPLRAEKIIDTNALNTCLSFASLCLLKYFNHSSLPLPVPSLENDQIDNRLKEQSYQNKLELFCNIDLSNVSVLDALSSRTMCRWEKFEVLVQSQCSNPNAPTNQDSLLITYNKTNENNSINKHTVEFKGDTHEYTKKQRIQNMNDTNTNRVWNIATFRRKLFQGSNVFVRTNIFNDSSFGGVFNDDVSLDNIVPNKSEAIGNTTLNTTSNSTSNTYTTANTPSGTVESVSNKVVVEVVFDVGHNPAAIAALIKRVKEEYSDGWNVRYECRWGK